MKSVKRLSKGDKVTGDYLDSLAAAIKELQRYAITGTQAPLRVIGQTLLFERVAAQEFWARIDSSTVEDTNRWTYAFTQVTKTVAGYGEWITKPGGITGNTSYNSIEDINSATGVQGNGVDLDELAIVAPGMTLRPIPANTIVRMYGMILATGVIEYWCQYESGISGPCEGA